MPKRESGYLIDKVADYRNSAHETLTRGSHMNTVRKVQLSSALAIIANGILALSMPPAVDACGGCPYNELCSLPGKTCSNTTFKEWKASCELANPGCKVCSALCGFVPSDSVCYQKSLYRVICSVVTGKQSCP